MGCFLYDLSFQGISFLSVAIGCRLQGLLALVFRVHLSSAVGVYAIHNLV